MDTEMLKLALNDAREIKNQLGIITGLENQVVYSSLEGLLEPHGEALAKSALERLRKEGCTIGYQNLVLNHIKNDTLKSINDFTAPENLIPLKNGIVDICTGNLIPYSTKLIQEKIIFTSQFAVEYDPKAKCPKILAALRRAQPNPEVQYNILRSWALCFDRKPMKRQTELYIGDNDTGKSTLLNVLKELLGKENIATQPLEALTATDTEAQRSRAQLFGKAANIFADLQQIELKQLGMYKALTGGDTVPCRFMYQSPIEYAPFVKFFFGCNSPPIIADESIQNDMAFFERFRITFFEQKLKRTDIQPDFLYSLTTKQELSGLFNILAGILKAVWRYRDYGYTFNAIETRALWNLSISRNSKVQKFIDRFCVIDPKGTIPKYEFSERLNRSLKEDGFEPVGSSDINERLSRIAKEDRNTGVRIWKGIRWKDEAQQTGLEAYQDGKDGFSTILGHFPEYNIKEVHKKSVFSVLLEGDGILRQWFANPLRVVYPRCERHNTCKSKGKTFPTLIALENHYKITEGKAEPSECNRCHKEYASPTEAYECFQSHQVISGGSS